jgi:hypothetical protein
MSPSRTGRPCNGRGKLAGELSTRFNCGTFVFVRVLCGLWFLGFKRRAIATKGHEGAQRKYVPERARKAVRGYFCAKLRRVRTCTLSALRDTIKDVPKRPCSLAGLPRPLSSRRLDGQRSFTDELQPHWVSTRARCMCVKPGTTRKAVAPSTRTESHAGLKRRITQRETI